MLCRAVPIYLTKTKLSKNAATSVASTGSWW